jgi:hypothetical protein
LQSQTDPSGIRNSIPAIISPCKTDRDHARISSSLPSC